MTNPGDRPPQDPERQQWLNAFRARYMIIGQEGVPFIELEQTGPLADQLRQKAQQYDERATRQKEAGTSPVTLTGYVDSKFKGAILDKLLAAGKIDLFSGLDAIYHGELNPDTDLTLRVGLQIMGSDLATKEGIQPDPETGLMNIPADMDAKAKLLTALNAFHVVQSYALRDGQGLEGGAGLPPATGPV